MRFGKDKSPYKTAASARFMAPGGGPGAYFHLEPGEIYAGGGLYHPEPAVARGVAAASWTPIPPPSTPPSRTRGSWPRTARSTATGSTRVPAGYAKDHPERDLLVLKDLIFTTRLGDDDVFSPDLPDTLTDLYAAAGPVWALLGRVAVG